MISRGTILGLRDAALNCGCPCARFFPNMGNYGSVARLVQ